MPLPFPTATAVFAAAPDVVRPVSRRLHMAGGLGGGLVLARGFALPHGFNEPLFAEFADVVP